MNLVVLLLIAFLVFLSFDGGAAAMPERLVFESTHKRQQDLPKIRIGTAHTAYGPNSGSGNLQARVWDLFVNTTPTYMVGGVLHGLQLISYLDDGAPADGATTNMIVEQLVLRDQVHLLVTGYGTNALKFFIAAAERLGVPCINSAAHEFSFQPISNFFWTVSPLPSVNTLGSACAQAYASVGAKTFVGAFGASAGGAGLIPIVHTALISSGILPIGNDTNATRALIITDDKFAKPELLDPIIENYKKLNPDIVVAEFGQVNNVIFMDRMRRKNYNPKGTMFWGTISQPLVRSQLAWKSAFTTVSEAYSPYLNTSDPVWGGTPQYEALYHSKYNSSTANADANMAASITLIDQALRVTEDLTPTAIRAAILGLNISTVVGPLSFTNQKVNRELYCFQLSQNSSTILTVWPASAKSFVNITYPAIITYPKGYFKSIDPNRAVRRTRNIALISVFSSIGGLAIIAGIVALWYNSKFHTIVVPKSPNNTEWGNGE